MQVIVGIIFTGIYFVVFRFLILKFNFLTPGREKDNAEVKLYNKEDYRNKKKAPNAEKATIFLEALGGKDNIVDVTNCATRLRISVKDESLVQDVEVFKGAGAHGLVKNGKAIQVIVGLSVPKVREDFEKLLV